MTALKEHEIVHAGASRKFQTPSIYEDLTVFENLEISFPRGWTMLGALAFKRDGAVRERRDRRRAESQRHGQDHADEGADRPRAGALDVADRLLVWRAARSVHGTARGDVDAGRIARFLAV